MPIAVFVVIWILVGSGVLDSPEFYISLLVVTVILIGAICIKCKDNKED